MLDPPTTPASPRSRLEFEVRHEPRFAALEAEQESLSAEKQDNNPRASPEKTAMTPAAQFWTPFLKPEPDREQLANFHDPQSTPSGWDLSATPHSPRGGTPHSAGTPDTRSDAPLAAAGSNGPSPPALGREVSPLTLSTTSSSFDGPTKPRTSSAALFTDQHRHAPTPGLALLFPRPALDFPLQTRGKQLPPSPKLAAAQPRTEAGTSAEITPRHLVAPLHPGHPPTERCSILSPWIMSWHHHRYRGDDAEFQDACSWYEQAILAVRSLGEQKVLTVGHGGIVIANREEEISRLPKGETEKERRTQGEDRGPELDGLELREGAHDKTSEDAGDGEVKNGDLETVGKEFPADVDM